MHIHTLYTCTYVLQLIMYCSVTYRVFCRGGVQALVSSVILLKCFCLSLNHLFFIKCIDEKQNG